MKDPWGNELRETSRCIINGAFHAGSLANSIERVAKQEQVSEEDVRRLNNWADQLISQAEMLRTYVRRV